MVDLVEYPRAKTWSTAPSGTPGPVSVTTTRTSSSSAVISTATAAWSALATASSALSIRLPTTVATSVDSSGSSFGQREVGTSASATDDSVARLDLATSSDGQRRVVRSAR